jgi:hypothetical protein
MKKKLGKETTLTKMERKNIKTGRKQEQKVVEKSFSKEIFGAMFFLCLWWVLF